MLLAETNSSVLPTTAIITVYVILCCQETAQDVERLYRANSGRGCCSDVCERGDGFDRRACNEVCNPDSVEDHLTYPYGGTGGSAPGFSSNVSGIIIPVEISDNGMYRAHMQY